MTDQNSFQNNSNMEKQNSEVVFQQFSQFLETYQELDEWEQSFYFYKKQAQEMVENLNSTLYVSQEHLTKYNEDLMMAIYQDYYKFEKFLQKAVYNFILRNHPDYSMHKFFKISFYNLGEQLDIRDLKTEIIGKLVSVKGTVTKTMEIKPELLYGKFKCKVCDAPSEQIEQQFSITYPVKCSQKYCTNQTKFKLMQQESVFDDWQKIKIQETANDLPSGAIPRSIDVVLRGEQVEKAQPGDRVVITGSLIAVPEKQGRNWPGERNYMTRKTQNMRIQNKIGMKKKGISDLNFKLVFLGNNVTVNKIKFAKEAQIEQNLVFETREQEKNYFLGHLSEAEEQIIDQMAKDPKVFKKLANLIAPSVLGNLEIKKGILMMLFGGVNKTTGDGMKIRGDLNICLVGDPSTAKSQFLKFIHNYIPRTVYTSGRGSTSAGLTASLTKDQETGDYTLEAGALLLADNGICCIDEFDKMQEKDKVAIHEAMEQQTISITKAGIQATLNAWSSILAAMNPIMGRYDKTKNLKSNVKLSPPLMSRFDLFFVLIDECNNRIDEAIAQRIVSMHWNFDNMEYGHKQEEELFNQTNLLKYMKRASFLDPIITIEAKELLKWYYINMRSNEYALQQGAYRITVRQMESLVRLSEACARIHLNEYVKPKHVQEAVTILRTSIIKIDSGDLKLEIFNPNVTTTSLIQQPKQKQNVQISKNDYIRISSDLKEILQECSEHDKKMTIEALSLQYLNNNIKEFKSIDEFKRNEKLVNAIIKYMIKNDKTFLLTGQDQEKYVELHPNLQKYWKN